MKLGLIIACNQSSIVSLAITFQAGRHSSPYNFPTMLASLFLAGLQVLQINMGHGQHMELDEDVVRVRELPALKFDLNADANDCEVVLKRLSPGSECAWRMTISGPPPSEGSQEMFDEAMKGAHLHWDRIEIIYPSEWAR